MKSPKKFRFALWIGAGVFFGCAYFYTSWKTQQNRYLCGIYLRNYTQNIASCGISKNVLETWKDPKKIEVFVREELKMRIPTCPSGGTYSMVYGRINPSVPYPALVCSCEKSHGHVNPVFEKELATYRQNLARDAEQSADGKTPEATQPPH